MDWIAVLKKSLFSVYGLPSLAAIMLTACATTPQIAGDRSVSNARLSVVKIYVSIQGEDYQMPWQSGRPGSASGTGFIIKGKRILSNAHVVSNARFLQVQKDGDPKKYLARVKFMGHDCDLAELEVDDDEFFSGTQPVELASRIPELNDEVSVLGYPMGGERVSITRGVVSRIDFSVYSHSGLDQHIIMQVDAAINPGNSGGPIFLDGKVVAVAFQGLMAGDNIGYGIPLPVIEHFLRDIEDGRYNGYPELGAGVRDGHNTGLRKALSIPDAMSGVAVDYIDPFAAANGKLLPGDFLIKIDGYNIENDGSVVLDGNSIVFAELLERKQWGETANLEVFRNGSTTNIIVPLTGRDDPFIYRNVYDEKPLYYIMAGLVFAPVNRALLYTVGHSSSQNRNQLFYFADFAKIDDLYLNRKEFVVMMRRLPHAVNSYADSFINGIVSSVNGVPITELKDVKEAFTRPENGFHVITFEGIEDRLIIEASNAEKADKEILMSYGILEKENFQK